MKKQIITAVNLHLTKSCNMKCKYCFAGFNKTKRTYPYKETVLLIKKLKDFGFEKINFVGGEPMLIPQISKLLKISKEMGFYTSLVTNGSLLTPEFLKGNKYFIDIIGMSVDSLNYKTNSLIGRKTPQKTMQQEDYLKTANLINLYGINLKINTVVSALNKNEDLFNFINKVNPIRWKIFQVLKIKGENDNGFNNFEISNEEFENFCNKQINGLNNKEIFIKEKNEIIRGSYLMINPEGQFFDNTKGNYTVSENINTVGVAEALKQINFNYEKFISRNGNYFNKTNIKAA